MMDEYRKYEPIFGSWYLSRLIGKGSFGKVFEITREEFGTTYRSALKIISVPQDDDDIKTRMTETADFGTISEYYAGILKEIVNENEIMAQLKGNSNIVSYEDHQIIPHDDGIGYDILIRMELLTPLIDRMVEKKLDEKEVVRLGIDMCKALELCHKKNIIHRDIKPQNIFISENGDFKLGDFGIARTIEKTSGGMSKKGTYKYMAPEVFKGENYDSTVDIYSLGIVLYTLLNGNRGPFLPAPPAKVTHNDEEEARMRRFRGEPLPAPRDARPMLAYIIQKACANAPGDRYHTAAQMRRDLENYKNNYLRGEETELIRDAGSLSGGQMRQPAGQYGVPQYAQAAYGMNGFEQPRNVDPPKRGSRLSAVLAVVIAAVLIAAAGLIVHYLLNKPGDTDDQGSETQTEEQSGNENQAQDEQRDILSDVYGAYADVLMDNEDGINGYTWQSDGSHKCVAVTDLTGDGIPELMFFTGDYAYVADLHVYTYVNGRAVEYSYDNSASMDTNGNTTGSNLFRDTAVAAGTKHMIYTGSAPGTLYIAYSMGDENTYYHSNLYRITDDCRIILANEVMNRYGPNADYTGHIDEYFINGSGVSDETGKAEFKADRDDFGKLIMYSGYVEDMNVFKKIDKTSPAAMTFNDALRMLQEY